MAAMLSNPLDVVKTRLQVQNYHSKVATAGALPKYTTARSMARGIWREEGVWAFTRGISARVMYVAPVSAITFMTYEFLKRFAQIDIAKDEMLEL
jgi:hypothetical protein